MFSVCSITLTNPCISLWVNIHPLLHDRPHTWERQFFCAVYFIWVPIMVISEWVGMFVECKITSHGLYLWGDSRGCWQFSQHPLYRASLGMVSCFQGGWFSARKLGGNCSALSPSCRIHRQWTHFCCILLATRELLARPHSREVSWAPPLDGRLMVALQKTYKGWKTCSWTSGRSHIERKNTGGGLLSRCCE